MELFYLISLYFPSLDIEFPTKCLSKIRDTRYPQVVCIAQPNLLQEKADDTWLGTLEKYNISGISPGKQEAGEDDRKVDL